MPLMETIQDGFAEAEVVVDLSDEPVLGPRERMLLASRVLAGGLRYEGADFRFEPPRYELFPVPSLAVIGTGKRIGKTAVTGHVARLLARDRDVVVVAMGRGFPRTADSGGASRRSTRCWTFPRGATRRIGLPRDRGAHRSGHGRLPACGRRARRRRDDLKRGRGAALAAEQEPDVVVFDGSGAAIPPIDVDARFWCQAEDMTRWHT